MPTTFKKLWFPGKNYDFQGDNIVSTTCKTMNCRSVAPNCFVRKAHLEKIGNIICSCPPPAKSCSFYSCCLSPAPLLPPLPSSSPVTQRRIATTSFSPCLLSLPRRGDPGESSVSGFQLASAQLLLERWLDSIAFSPSDWRCCKMLMAFSVSSCICWDVCFSHVRKYAFS